MHKRKLRSQTYSDNSYRQVKRKMISQNPIYIKSKDNWSILEDDVYLQSRQQTLQNIVSEQGENWKIVSQRMGVFNKTAQECENRWNALVSIELIRVSFLFIKGPWSKEEDELLAEKVKKYGNKKWKFIASQIPGKISGIQIGRNGKQCRERWNNHLDPVVKKTPWELWEDELLLDMQSRIGNRWSKISALLPGR